MPFVSVVGTVTGEALLAAPADPQGGLLTAPADPSCPLALQPQHWTVPFMSAQVWNKPAAMSSTPFNGCPEESTTTTGSGVKVVSLRPSSPSSPLPQHSTVPRGRRAQVWNWPAAIDITFGSGTARGGFTL
jgi:hypothetical protein